MSILDNIIKTHGVEKLNTLTKYPSIMTYHNLGDKGSLVESLVDDKDFSSFGSCYITEKIDGTNARIIYTKDDFIIGSREELLYSRGDRFANSQLNIVDTIREYAERISIAFDDPNLIRIVYGEVYGGNVTQSSKQYTNDKTFGFRVFDISEVDLSILSEPIDKISSWREHGGQSYHDVDFIKRFADGFNIEIVPYLNVVDGKLIPTDRISTLKYLQQFADTKAGINNSGRAEGIVIRSFDRGLIRKIRFEDYERTAKREKWEM